MKSDLSKKYYITPCHVYSPGCDLPTVINNSLFDTGASLTFITLEFLQKLNLEDSLIRDKGGGCLGGDQEVMKGFIGRAQLNIAVEDTSGFLTKNFSQSCEVYTGLNHDLVLGRDAIGVGIRSFLGIPEIDLLIFNPTSRQVKDANKKLAEFEKKTSNNLKSVTPVADSKDISMASVQGSSGPEFSESERFLLNIPGYKQMMLPSKCLKKKFMN